MSKYQAYPEYKETGFGWLGNIPTHWVVSPIKWQIEKISGGAWGQDPDGVEDTFVLRSTEQTHDGGWKIEDPASRKLSPQEIETTLLKEDDLLMTKSSGSSLHIGKTTIVTEEVAKLRCGYSNFMQRIRIKEDYVARFYWYIFNNELARKQLDYLSSSTTGLANLNATVIGEIICSNPSKIEQEKIVDFLDHETAKIDTLIGKQQQLIQLLKEKRQAVISHAVTKGLNPNAPMRDSGVEWLGEVPEHWVMPKVSHLGRVLNGSTPDKTNFSYWEDGTIPWLASGCLNSEIVSEPSELISKSAYQNSSVELIPANSLLVGMVGQGKTRGTSAILAIDSCINQNMAAVIPNDKVQVRFLYFVFQAMYDDLRELGRGGNQAALNCEIIGSLRVPLPPSSEQKAIVEMLDELLIIFNKVSSLAEKQISLMQERRTALISAAVTGKIDVRNWESPDSAQNKEAV